MAVKIVRVLNTNAVVSSDQEGRELIITGAGIGFKKKKGENLDEALADKTYYLESVDDSRRLQEVVKEISEEYLEIVSRIVKTAREEAVSYTQLDVYKRQPYNPAELIARVKAHLRRYRAWSGGETEKKKDPDQIVNGGLVLDKKQRVIFVEGEEVHLSLIHI